MCLLSQERMNQNFHRQKVFVSYLSRYSKYYKGTSSSLPNVESIFSIISYESKVALEDIQYFPPGKISLELMTKQRRFEIVQLTEPYVAGCKEFWIYETPDYDSSWWTYGEKLSLVHIYKDDMDKCPDICVATPVKNKSGQWVIKIRRYSTVEEKKKFLPALTEEQKQLMEIIYVNSSLDTVAYEQVEMMQKLSEVPKGLLKLWIRLNRKSFLDYMRQISFWLPADEQNELMSQTLDIQSLVESAKSTVYSKDFWGNHVIECPVCRARLKYVLNPEAFYSFDSPYYFSISSEQYLEIKKVLEIDEKYYITLPCGHTVSVKKNDFIYYRWWTVRSNHPTHPDGKLLERMETVSVNFAENK